ncbi:hypothetical protein [Sphingomonas sp. S2-65]|uniref:hypothetical protein n=1 Tax=Sphingomonas sp. S2-65 TaxID=2903960 RepID=UPI001F2DDFCC|nr:hypothetical protein [Sphingomonas sp. S2-65]UYY57097.1 hypothetical protein LZ586_10395 [Sphingomonas sp. S2-65]
MKTSPKKKEPLEYQAPGVHWVTIDKGWLDEALERYAEAVCAVERANNRAAGFKLERHCTAALFATGTTPPICRR